MGKGRLQNYEVLQQPLSEIAGVGLFVRVFNRLGHILDGDRLAGLHLEGAGKTAVVIDEHGRRTVRTAVGVILGLAVGPEAVRNHRAFAIGHLLQVGIGDRRAVDGELADRQPAALFGVFGPLTADGEIDVSGGFRGEDELAERPLRADRFGGEGGETAGTGLSRPPALRSYPPALGGSGRELDLALLGDSGEVTPGNGGGEQRCGGHGGEEQRCKQFHDGLLFYPFQNLPGATVVESPPAHRAHICIIISLSLNVNFFMKKNDYLMFLWRKTVFVQVLVTTGGYTVDDNPIAKHSGHL